jgi:signal transduction histidine kinase/ActR/RegA family two-component response regulator
MAWHVSLAVFLLIADAVLCFVLAWLTWRRRKVPGRLAFTLLMAMIGEWTISYAFELAAPDLQSKLFFDELEYIGIVANPVCAVAFALLYSGRGRWLIPKGLVALSVVPAVTLILVWTSPTRGLVQTSVAFDPTGPFPGLAITHGVWFWIHVAYSYSLLAAATVILFATLLRSPEIYRSQVVAMLIGILAPLLSNVAFLSGYTPFPHLDLTPFAFSITGTAMFLAFFRLRFLELVLGLPFVARTVLVNELPDAVILLDNRGNVVEANLTALRVLDRPALSLVGRPIDQFLPGWIDLKAGGSTTWESHREVSLGPAGGRRSYDLVVSPQYLGDRYLAGWTLVLRDVTAYKEIQTDLSETNRQLAAALVELRMTQEQVLQQERLRALGEMASGIAHDFNNALAIVSGFLELLGMMTFEDDVDPPKIRSYLTVASVAAADATSVVRRLRDFYRPRGETEQDQPIDLNALVRQTRELTKLRWQVQSQAEGSQIGLNLELGAISAVVGNSAQLREVLTNLIFNAVDALPRGGMITVTTEQKGEQVLLSVADDGIGMTEEVRRRCLEPFFTTKGPSGSGMGLAVVYGIIRRHNGTLDIVSEVGHGTRVTVGLQASRFEPVREATLTGEASQSRPLSVLLVEDLPQLRDLFRLWLTEAGHRVEVARNGREGLERFLLGWYDVVITDQAMAELTGDQLAQAIRQRAPGKPIILLSGLADLPTTEVPPIEYSAVLSKPVTVAALLQALAAVSSGQSIAEARIARVDVIRHKSAGAS